MKAVEQMRTALAQGDALAVFPEGTTKATTQIGPLRSGAFRACAGLAVDIWGVAMTFPDGFGWGRQGRGLVNHLRDVAAHAPLQVDVCFQKFEALPSGYAQAARFCREKLQDLDTLLRTQRER